MKSEHALAEGNRTLAVHALKALPLPEPHVALVRGFADVAIAAQLGRVLSPINGGF
jgi:hypothetical protein